MSDAVFPTFIGLSWPVKRIPRFNTKIKSAISGKETRAAFAAYPKYDIELTFDYLSVEDWRTLGGFFKLRKGRFDSFLFEDLEDNTITAQPIGVGDGVNFDFQLLRTSGGFTEPVMNPKNATVKIYLNGVLKTEGVDYDNFGNGYISFYNEPAVGVVVTWTGEYYYRVRFMADESEFSQAMKTLFELKKLGLVGATGNLV